MDELADFYPQLLVPIAALLLALAAAPLAERLGVPPPGAFLAAGVVLGLAYPDALGSLEPITIERIGVIVLFVILFHGGLVTGGAAFRQSFREIALLGLLGTAATAAALALVGRGLGLDWELAVPVGIALAPTDPAAVYAALRQGGSSTRARTVLEGESGFNDPIGISLMAVALIAIGGDGGGSVTDGAVRLAEELGVGTAIGLGGGLALRRALPLLLRLEDALRPVALVAGAALVGTLTGTLHGSGFLAVYLCGLVVSDAWQRLDGSEDHLVPGLATAAEPFLFSLLGAAFAPLLGARDVLDGLVLASVGAFVVRPLVAAVCTAGGGLTRPERLLVSWGGLKGAVPLLLAAYPALEGLRGAERVEAVVLVATAASIVVQGATLERVARRASPSRPTPRAAPP